MLYVVTSLADSGQRIREKANVLSLIQNIFQQQNYHSYLTGNAPENFVQHLNFCNNSNKIFNTHSVTMTDDYIQSTRLKIKHSGSARARPMNTKQERSFTNDEEPAGDLPRCQLRMSQSHYIRPSNPDTGALALLPRALCGLLQSDDEAATKAIAWTHGGGTTDGS